MLTITSIIFSSNMTLDSLKKSKVIKHSNNLKKIIDEVSGISPEEIKIREDLALVKKDPSSIRFIESPAEIVQLTAINLDYFSFTFIDNPTEKAKLLAVKKNAKLLFQLVKDRSYDVQVLGISLWAANIQHIKNPSEEMQMLAIARDPWNIQYIKNPTDLVKKKALREDGYLIKFPCFEGASEEMYRLAVSSKPSAIKWIKDPSEGTQLIVVRSSPREIVNIENPTLKTQLLAITSREAKSIIRDIKYYIPNQHPELAKEYAKWVLNEINKT